MIQSVISPKGSGTDSTEVVIRMWDENLMILGVDKKISKKIKKGDYAITDYNPLTPMSPYRKMLITKILPHDEGSKIWLEFRNESDRKKMYGTQNR